MPPVICCERVCPVINSPSKDPEPNPTLTKFLQWARKPTDRLPILDSLFGTEGHLGFGVPLDGSQAPLLIHVELEEEQDSIRPDDALWDGHDGTRLFIPALSSTNATATQNTSEKLKNINLNDWIEVPLERGNELQADLERERLEYRCPDHEGRAWHISIEYLGPQPPKVSEEAKRDMQEMVDKEEEDQQAETTSRAAPSVQS